MKSLLLIVFKPIYSFHVKEQELSMKNKFNISETDKSGDFLVSENYFDELSTNILNKTIHKTSNSKFNIPNYKIVAIAASILVVAGLISIKIFIQDNNENKSSKIESYILNQVDSDLIVEFIDENNMMNIFEIEDLDYIDESLLIDEL